VQTVGNQVSAKRGAMQKLNLNSVVQRDPDVIAAEAGEDVVMVHIDKGQYYGVSEIAREIWQAIDRPKKVSDLIGDLVANYSVDKNLCEKETLLFLNELLNEQLLQVRNGSSS
jgi:hypothetical protein